MSGKILFLLFLNSAIIKGNKNDICERKGPVNMTFVVITLNQVVTPYGPPAKTEEGIREIRAFRKETRQAIQNIMDTLNQIVSSNEVPVKPHEETMEEVRGFRDETRQAVLNITYVLVSVMETQRQLQRDVKFIKNIIANDSCGDEALYYSSSCYTADVIKRTWNEARNNCRSHSSDLVSIETAGENEFLETMMNMNKYSSVLSAELKENEWFGFWTSGSDEDEEGTWIWKATGSPFSYVNWDKTNDNPNNQKGKQHHMSILVNGTWNDRKDDQNMFSFCEKVLPY